MGYHDFAVANDRGRELAAQVLRGAAGRAVVTDRVPTWNGATYGATCPMPLENGECPAVAEKVKDKGTEEAEKDKADVTNAEEKEPAVKKAVSVKKKSEKVAPEDAEAARLAAFVAANEWAFPRDVRTFAAIEDKGLGDLLSASRIDDATRHALLDSDKAALRLSLMAVVSEQLNGLARDVKGYKNIKGGTSLDSLSAGHCVLLCTYVLMFVLVEHAGAAGFVNAVTTAFVELVRANTLRDDIMDDLFEHMRETYNQKTYGGLKTLDKEDGNVYMELMNAKLVDKYVAEEKPVDAAEEAVDVLPVDRDDDNNEP